MKIQLGFYIDKESYKHDSSCMGIIAGNLNSPDTPRFPRIPNAEYEIEIDDKWIESTLDRAGQLTAEKERLSERQVEIDREIASLNAAQEALSEQQNQLENRSEPVTC